MQQVEVLEYIQRRFDLSLREMSREMGMDPSRLSRYMSRSEPDMMTAKAWLGLMRLLGEYCSDWTELQEVLQETGLKPSKDECYIAEKHLSHKAVLRGVPQMDPDRYVERGEEKELRAKLVARGALPPLILIVEGMPGVGKTALVMHMLGDREIQKRFSDGIFWVRMENREEEIAMQELAEMVLGNESLDRRDLRRAVRDALRGSRSLVVLDGAEERIDLDWWMVVDPFEGRLMVTTRRRDLRSRDWERRVWRKELDVLPEVKARALLTQGVQVDVEEEAIKRLLELLGGLPLALEIANRLAVMDGGFQILMAEMKKQVLEWLEVKPPRYKEESLRLAFDMSYRRLEERVAALFRFLSVFPQPFEVEPVARVIGWEEAEVGRALRTLRQHGLVQVERSGCYAMHRLLHEYAGELAEKEDLASLPQWEERFAQYYLGVTREAFEKWRHGEERQAFQIWQQTIIYVERGYSYAADLERSDWALEYLRHTSFYLGNSGLGELVERWRERFTSLVQDREKRSQGGSYLANAYLLLGKPNEALPFLQEARQAWAEEGNERMWLDTTLSLVQAFLAAGQPAAAVALTVDQHYAQIAEALPMEDPLKAKAWVVCGMVRQNMGRWADARYCYLKALESLQGTGEGKLKWHRGRLLYSVGEALLATGELMKALTIFEEGMRAAEAGNYQYLWGLHALGQVMALALLGKGVESKAALATARKRVEEDPRLSKLMHIAEAEVAWALGAWDVAEQAYRAAAEESVGTLLEVDIWVLLADRLKEQGKRAQAVEAWQRARESGIRTRYWYKYLVATLEYGKYLWEEGRQEEARPLLTEVATRGSEETAYQLVAEALEILGMKDEAEIMQARALVEEELYLWSVVAAEMGFRADGYFGVLADGEWQWLAVPGFGEEAVKQLTQLRVLGTRAATELPTEDQMTPNREAGG